MAYRIWFEKHAQKHEKIVSKLRKEGFTKNEVIAYFDFDNMKRKEEDFCPLYIKNKKCHDMDALNCYICACPNFRFDDEGIGDIEGRVQYSLCSIDSKEGRQGIYGEAIHQDCSKCGVPHHLCYVEKLFEWSWRDMMKKCILRA